MKLISTKKNTNFCISRILAANYQKYSIYKEWTEIKSFMMDYKNINLSNNNDMKIDIEKINTKDEGANIENNKESLINEKNEF